MLLRKGRNTGPSSTESTSDQSAPASTENETKSGRSGSTTSDTEEATRHVAERDDDDGEDRVDASVTINNLSFTESEQSAIRKRLVEYFANKRRTSLPDVLRLIGLLVIAVASIFCIAYDIYTVYFANILTLTFGILLDSPLGGGKAATDRDARTPAAAAG